MALFVFNALIVAAPSAPGRQWLGLPLLYVGLLTGFVVVITTLTGPTFIPNAIMRIYKFGHFQVAVLVLDEKACKIAKDHGLSEALPCQFSNVMIRSRVGTTYYIEGLRRAPRLALPYRQTRFYPGLLLPISSRRRQHGETDVIKSSAARIKPSAIRKSRSTESRASTIAAPLALHHAVPRIRTRRERAAWSTATSTCVP